MKRLPKCQIPDQLSQAIREAGRQWAISDLRPRLDTEIERDWDKLIKEWAESDLPLVIRKGGGIRGSLAYHKSGRRLVYADNSPAQWAFSRAFNGNKYSLSEISNFFEDDLLPFALVAPNDEKEKKQYQHTLSSKDCVNNLDWKLCHIRSVGLNNRTKAVDLPIELLVQHFCAFLMPSNHFLVPSSWAGFGEIPEVIEELSKVGV